MPFINRKDAGERLADALSAYRGIKDGIVIALPRGGVVLGRVVADRLGLPLDIVVSRKIGAPSNPEYAIGALTEMGDIVWNEAERALHDARRLATIVEEQKREAERRMAIYREGMPERVIRGRTVIVVDDGIATGFTIMAAMKTVRALRPKRIVIAVPVAPPDSLAMLASLADEVVVLYTPESFHAVGAHYQEFGEVKDEEVIGLLQREKREK